MQEEIKTIITINRHVRLVQKHLIKLAQELERRAQEHDISKLAEDEFAGFVQINQVARKHKYGSDEYKASLEAVEPNPIQLHYSRNSHHPEHYKNGISDMSLVDIIEMVCDWKAASETYGQTDFMDSVNISIKRFKPSAYQEYMIRIIADYIN